MPSNLREAHERNDETLERIYIGRRFKNDTEQLEKLFEMYQRMRNWERAIYGSSELQRNRTYEDSLQIRS